MTIINKINYLIEEKNLTKKEFANILQSLEPKLNSTGNIPNEQTIYGYLNGKRELKVELIPYIAETLNVTEQELFSFDIEYASEYNIRYSKEAREILDLLQYAPKNMIEHIKNALYRFKVSYDEGIKKV
ncbi:MAG: helix-turn-helix transcriptional regulator [Campylobacterota bacterium]|nr:helix-turn-helix transcriptional regulator [Campylobacterota bacterium]